MNVEAYSALLPEVTAENRPYWDGCAAGELRLQSCDGCGARWFPQAPVCPRCLSDSFTWKAASGAGTLWSWITMHQRYLPAFADELPYLVAYVKLAEGPFMISTLVDPPDELRLDLPVHAVFEPNASGRTIVKFAVAEGAAR